MRSFIPTLALLLACGADETPTSPAPAPDVDPPAAPPAAASTADAPPASSTTTEDPPTEADVKPPPQDHSGDATYYAATTSGACGIKTPSDKLVAAMGSSLYSKTNCGQCAEVTGPKGTVVVLLNDKCGACTGNSLDLSTQAFTQIADKSAGRVKVTWHFTDCP